MGVLRKTLATHAPCSTVLIRLIVGGTFLSEGIQKFLFPMPWAWGDSPRSASPTLRSWRPSSACSRSAAGRC